jgi:uncharacterized protein YecT (DUF1311 family)
VKSSCELKAVFLYTCSPQSGCHGIAGGLIMSKIFISYRRDDAGEAAGRLSDNLVERFGRENIFMDVDGIALGRDFRTVIEETLGQCGVLLAVMGKSWLQNTDAKGNRRLDQPDDFVRLEIGTALKRDIPVIPVCVQGAGVPAPDDLPDELKNFAFREAFELTHARWDSDVQNLIERLQKNFAPLVAVPTESVKKIAEWCAMRNRENLRYERAEKDLDGALAGLMKQLDETGKLKLRTSQTAWLQFRQADADFEADMAGGGTIAPLINMTVMADLTEARVRNLRNCYDLRLSVPSGE